MTDPFTLRVRLCDNDGIVRCGAMHHGTDYVCTGSAHYGGDHIECTSPAHNTSSLSDGGYIGPVGPILITLSADECLVNFSDVQAGRLVCSRAVHPTPTSDCTTTRAIRHRSEIDR